MDYIDDIFDKYSRIETLRSYRIAKMKRVMTREEFRYAVEDIEAEHLKRVCKT